MCEKWQKNLRGGTTQPCMVRDEAPQRTPTEGALPMSQAVAQVIMPRRGFLTRALGFTAAGATLALPIVTVADARARAKHHMDRLHSALNELYPGTTFTVRSRLQQGQEADPRCMIDQFCVLFI